MRLSRAPKSSTPSTPTLYRPREVESGDRVRIWARHTIDQFYIDFRDTLAGGAFGERSAGSGAGYSTGTGTPGLLGGLPVVGFG